MYSLVVDRVVKRYGATVAVDDLSFAAHPGRLFGVLGPNGAGKTSTLRMVAHVTAPDAGRITFGGRPVGPATQAVTGYLPEERGLYRSMRVGEQLTYLGQLKGLPRARARAAARHWLARLGALDWYGRRVEDLSKGMQQQVQFIATVLHKPQLCILDEPFSGLDPLNATLLREIVLELRDAGCTVLFASHRLEQVEQLCDDLVLIAGGRAVLQGTLREVKARFGRNTVALAFDGDGAFLETLAAEGAVRVLHRGAGSAEVRLLGSTPPRRVLEAALGSVRELYRFEVVEPPLAEIFARAVQREAPAVAPAAPSGS